MSSSPALAWLALLLLVALYAAYVLYQRATFQADVVCLGDSLTASGGVGGRYTDFLAESLPGVRIVNQGQGGRTLADGRARFERHVLLLRPKVVVIELGANDFHRAQRPVEALRDDLEYMVREATRRGIGVVIAGVFGPQLDEEGQTVPKKYPQGKPEFGQALFDMERDIAQRYGCRHIENIQARLTSSAHWTDGRHPSPAGNRLVAEELLPHVTELLDIPLMQKEP